jgi:UDP-4-amino-4,6-dideoxy-N-acetyl-beta-L-altrosamine transaminase
MMIPYGRQHITEDDLKAVEEVLRSDWLTCGPAGPRFEEAAAAKVGAAEAVAVNSATSALHLACLALDLGPDDLLWTSPNTFVASANCARYCGAEVDFVDIDPRTYNLSPEALADKLKQAAKKNRLPKVIVPVHFAGQSCDMRAIFDLGQEYGFKIIEDASHAVGGAYLGEPVGRGRYSDLTVFSFHPVKIITTGEGGLVLTQNHDLAGRIKRLRSHGITREPELIATPADGPWYYQQLELGFNYRLTDIQAALGLSQLGRLDQYVARRRELAARYDRLLAGLPLLLPYQAPDSESAFHLYPVQIDSGRTDKTRLEVFNHLRAGGIGVNVHYIPVHTQPYYRRLGFKPGDFPEAEKYYAGALSLPLFYGLSEADQDYVAATLKEAF